MKMKKRKKLPEFAKNRRPRRDVQLPAGYPAGPPQFAFSRKASHTAPPSSLARAAPRPGRLQRGRSPRPLGP